MTRDHFDMDADEVRRRGKFWFNKGVGVMIDTHLRSPRNPIGYDVNCEKKGGHLMVSGYVSTGQTACLNQADEC
jgi:hypothetical protein